MTSAADLLPATATASLDGTHTVLTPEYVEFRFTLAGVPARALAWALDLLVVAGLTAVVLLVLSLVMVAFPGFGSALTYVAYFLIDWGYFIALETAWSGQTLGKRALGLRVIQESGVRIGFYHAALRNLARLVDRLPVLYLVGGVSALLSERSQRLGDHLAGTLVVRERRLKAPAALDTSAGAGLLADPGFVQRVRRLSAEARELVLTAALRREELQLEARLRLFSELGEYLEEALAHARPAHLSPEKWSLLVAAALLPKDAGRKRTPEALGTA